jgi:branched-chain amino acid aminotransferase
MRAWVGTRDGGRLADEKDATVSVLDHAFTVGDGVFETLKVTAGRPFAITRHLRRLAASASAMGMQVPDDAVIRRAIDEVLAACDLVDHGRLRITYTGGVGPLGSDRANAVPTLVVAATPTTPWPDSTSVVTVPWTRNERSALAGIKSTSYGENVVALTWAHDRGASEAVFANGRGELCEGTGTNVFVVIDGQVLTPSLASGCLAGITRELVLEWFDATEADVPLEVLATADEVFVTSSTRNVHPVTRCDDRTWTEPGAVSAALRAAFDAHAGAELDP